MEKKSLTNDLGAIHIQDEGAVAVESGNNDGKMEKKSLTSDIRAIHIQDEGAVAVESSHNDEKIDGFVTDRKAKKDRLLCGVETCVLLRKKYHDLKQTHMELCLQHCQLSMKYEAIRRVKTGTEPIGTEPTGTEPTGTEPSASDDVSVPDPLPLTDNIFTTNEIILLESLPLDKSHDSNFILKCVEYAYKENPSVLVTKTLKGTRERIEIQDGVVVAVRPAKDSLTPEKVKKIEDVFINRVTKSKCLAGEFAERIKPKNINRLIGSAVSNISNKAQPKVKPSQKNDHLNL